MNRNYFLFISLASFVILLGSGCKKELDVQPYNAFTDESVFTTPERINLAINGVYDAAQSGFYPANTADPRGYPFGAANVAQGENRGEDVINLQAFYQITYQATYNPTTANNVAYWASLYRLINFANVANDGLQKAADNGVITSEIATSAQAEMRFVRAWAHHELVTFFARPYLDGNGSKSGIPYRDFAVASSESVVNVRTEPRPTVAFVYEKLLTDLDFAIENLPVEQSSTYRRIRAEKAAAIILKQKVLMHMGRWQDSKTEGDKLVPASVNPLSPTSVSSPIGGYTLTAAPEASFESNSLSSENIFSIKNDPLDNPGVNAALGTMFGDANLGARALVALSPIVWNRTEWLEDDARRTNLFVLGKNAFGVDNASMFTTKYSDYVQRGDNNPIFRYAEAILMLAEAEARIASDVSSRAVDLLNVVRNRSIPSPATDQYSVTSFADKAELLQAILWERRFEFAVEGKRWQDIHRTVLDEVTSLRPVGIPAKLISGSYGAAIYGIGVALPSNLQQAIPYDDYRFIWPIPSDEITQNPILEQNPGY